MVFGSRKDEISLSQQIENDIRSKILSGEVKVGDRLPPERAIAVQYGVSRMTARQALMELAGQNILYRVRGKGTFVANLPRDVEEPPVAGSRTIAVVLPTLEMTGFVRTFAAAHDSLTRMGYRTDIGLANNDPLQEREALLSLSADGVDGLILLAARSYSYMNAELISAINERLPLVVLGAGIPGLAADRVYSDDRRGAYLVTRHLIELGHRKIAHLSASEELLDGYKDALAEHGIEYDPSLVRSTRWKFEDGYSEAKKLIISQPEVTAIFACSDIVAAAAYRALAEMSIEVPDGMALAGFGNEDFGQFLEVTLTTVDQSAGEEGRAAVRLLLDRISGRRVAGEHTEIKLPAELIVRKSCGIRRLIQPSGERSIL